MRVYVHRMQTARVTIVTVSMLVGALAGCGSAEPEPATPTPSGEPTPAKGPDHEQLHAALVTAHKKAVDVCFGGFGKGAPYAADLTMESGSVTAAAFEPLNSKFPDIPIECLDKTFKAMPMAGASEKVHVEFAVKNESCDVPACEKDDLKCTFERDISCSVVIR